MSLEFRGHILLVTGGGGFVGKRLCEKIATCGAKEVRAVDINFASNEKKDDKISGEHSSVIKNMTLDITRDCSELRAAFKDVHAVFHLASAGMSGRQMLDRDLCERVNVIGTRNVLRACKAGDVEHLIFTSTYNVIFGCDPIYNGDETMAYFEGRETDHYAPTKRAAERMVLDKFASCCVLRPAAIYGDDEDRHFPRIAMMMRMGLFKFVIGDTDVLSDWLHVDNFVEAQLLALSALRRGSSRGEAYFISDGAPVNSFEFLRPLAKALGIAYPNISIPTDMALKFATFCEALYFLFGVPPMFSRAEVLKVGMTHYFSIAKATRELGYVARIRPESAVPQAVDALIRRTERKAHTRIDPPVLSWTIALTCIYVSLWRAEAPSSVIIFVCIVHLLTAIWAGAIAFGRGRAPAVIVAWILQTVIAGGPSILALLNQKA